MIDSQWFSLSPTLWSAAFGLALIAICCVLSWTSVKRHRFKPLHIGLESLRLVMVTLVALAICQPEWLQNYVPDGAPVIAVIWDQSRSMETQDVPVTQKTPTPTPTPTPTSTSTPTSTPLPKQTPSTISRNQSIQQWLDPKTWVPFKDRFEVVLEPFSSTLKDAQQASDLNAALASTIEKQPNLRAAVMISDGSWNIGGSPTQSATRLRIKNVPVYTVAAGSEIALPDLEVTALNAPAFGVTNKPVRIPFSVRSTLPRDVAVTVSLTSSGGDLITQQYTIPSNETLQEALVWQPQNEGEYTLTLDVPVAAEERVTENNSMSAPILIRRKPLKVLVVDSYPRWEYRYLRNALVRDPGVEVACLLYHPKIGRVGGGKDYIKEFPQTISELLEFDVIFLGDVGVEEGQLTLEDCRRIKGVVENQATGLILMPGLRGRQFSLVGTELEKLLPIRFDLSQRRGWGSSTPAQFQLTEIGQESLLTKLADSPKTNAAVWESLPGFQWYAPVLRPKFGAQVLAVHERESNENGRIPLLVTMTYGTGKILFMGTDGAWRWREGVEDKYHYRFWGQVARWMAYQRNMASGESMRLAFSPDQPQVGQSLALNANVMTVDGNPLQSGTVNVQIVAPSGDSQNIKLSQASESGEWGLYSGRFEPQEIGAHEATLTCRETAARLTTKINVQGQQREKIGRPANLETLREIAMITGGKMVNSQQVEELLGTIADLPEPEPQVRRVRLWAHPILAGMMIGLLGIFWVGRKYAGVV